MLRKLFGCTVVLLCISGCDTAPPPFDVAKVDCKNAEAVAAISHPEHRAKAQAHCARLKSRESRFQPSDDNEWAKKN